MALSGYMGPRGLEDLAAALVTEDSLSAYTVDTLVRLEGAQAMNITPQFETVEQQVRDKTRKDSSIVGAQIQIQLGDADIESLKQVYGGLINKTADEHKWTRSKGHSLPYLYLVGRNAQLRDTANPNADVLYIFPKCKVESGDLGNLAQGSFAEPSITFFGEYTVNKSNWSSTDETLWTVTKRKTGSALAVGTPDTTPPSIDSSTPADAATGVAVSSNLTVTFDESILFNASQFTLLKVNSVTDTVTVACTVTYDGVDTVTVNPDADLDATQEYILLVGAVQDLAGNAMTATSINFTTA